MALTEWDVLRAIESYTCKTGLSPTIRDLNVELGYWAVGPLWEKVNNLVKVGAIRWDKSDAGVRRKERSMVLNVPLIGPTKIPVVGVLGGPMDFAPGEKWVEIQKDGTISYEGLERRLWIIPE